MSLCLRSVERPAHRGRKFLFRRTSPKRERWKKRRVGAEELNWRFGEERVMQQGKEVVVRKGKTGGGLKRLERGGVFQRKVNTLCF